LRITGIDNTTDPTVAIIAHAAGTTGSPFNPPAANNIFPTGGYAGGDEFGARVFNAGGMAENSYALNASNNLVLTDTAGTATPVADNIVNLQAQYGITAAGGGAVSCWVNATNPGTPAACDTADWANPSAANLRRIRAVRIAVVARNPLQERNTVTPAAWSLLDGTVTGTLSAAQQQFRYKIYETIVPSRNLVWANM
jgi:type IV pilus assembly protein PilW